MEESLTKCKAVGIKILRNLPATCYLTCVVAACRSVANAGLRYRSSAPSGLCGCTGRKLLLLQTGHNLQPEAVLALLTISSRTSFIAAEIHQSQHECHHIRISYKSMFKYWLAPWNKAWTNRIQDKQGPSHLSRAAKDTYKLLGQQYQQETSRHCDVLTIYSILVLRGWSSELQSLQDFFQLGLVPADTDYRMFSAELQGSLPGIDTAFLLGAGMYHTDRDAMQNLCAGTLQV